VNSGDGGYTAINPDNPAEWFTANTNVSIQRCEFGGNYHAQDFNNGLVVSNATVGGDSGAFYTPYILDPQNSGTLIVGTCQVWRGATNGAGFSVLSNNFETGGDGICSGNEVNLVRSLAAGGIKDTSGFSNVMYAGTDGLGPLAPTGGHVWVSTNVDSTAWFDRTGASNPGKFPISSAAIDPSDKTGKTAYVAIMGFHVAHVWKTSNSGVNWTDFTANLPDAPVNAMLIDAGSSPSTGTIYVGTDVGVFSSSTGAVSWTEVGPVSGSGQAGFLPNVSVTALHMFNSGGNKILRASTYGRGVWQLALTAAPDFEFSIANNSATVFAGQTAVFNGTVLGINGYGSAVNLSCTSGATPLPATCAMTPSSVTPTASFSVNAGGPVGDYFFNAHGVGTDPNSLARNFGLTWSILG
jgi:large repetitive protein